VTFVEEFSIDGLACEGPLITGETIPPVPLLHALGQYDRSANWGAIFFSLVTVAVPGSRVIETNVDERPLLSWAGPGGA
jgi:hypothetical protein